MGLLTGCDGAGTRTIDFVTGTQTEAAELYRLYILGDLSGMQKLIASATERPAFAFYAGLGHDTGSIQRTMRNDKAAVTFYQAAKGPYISARFNLCLVKIRLGMREGLEEDFLSMCKVYLQRAMVAYAAYKEKSDPQAAAYWYEKALEEGNYPWATLQLGRMLVDGRGRDANPEAALKLFRAAGELGVLDALEDLGKHTPTPTEQLDWTLRYLFGAGKASIERLDALRVKVGMDFKPFAERADFARDWLHVHPVKPIIETSLPHRTPIYEI